MTVPVAEPAILVRETTAAAAEAVGEVLATALAAAARERGRADFASTGGSAPVPIYRAMLNTPLRSRIPWSALHLWVGDDRFVPRDDADRNMVPIDHLLLREEPDRGLAPAPLDPDRVHPWPIDDALGAGEGPAWCAARFEEILRRELPLSAGPAGLPRFDAILLGVGPDGHLLSVFPGSAAFDAPGAATWAPAPLHLEPHLDRVTLTPRMLDVAPAIVVAAFGEGKAAIIGKLLGPGHADPAARAEAQRELPSLRARRAGATWVLDSAAAGALAPDDPRRVP